MPDAEPQIPIALREVREITEEVGAAHGRFLVLLLKLGREWDREGRPTREAFERVVRRLDEFGDSLLVDRDG